MRGVYLNHAGTSWPKPDVVLRAADATWRSDPLDWSAQFVRDHRTVAAFFGVEDPAQLLLTPSCTSAINVAVHDHFWNPGDRVLISAWEHHALHRPAAKLAEYGVDVEVLPHTEADPVILESLEHELKQGRVKLVAITAACNVTGDLLPIHDVIRLAHEYESRVLIDAAQVAGWLDLNLAELGADLVTFAGHKGPLAPWGIGGLYLRPGLQMNSPAAICEIKYDSQTGKTQPPPSLPGYCDVGSVNRPALAGLAAGVQWLGETGRQDRLTDARRLTQLFYDACQDMDRVNVYGSSDRSERMPTVAFNFEGVSSTDVAKQFLHRDVIVSGGLQCAPLAHKSLGTNPDGAVRLSVGPSTSEQDIQTAIAALGEIVQSPS